MWHRGSLTPLDYFRIITSTSTASAPTCRHRRIHLQRFIVSAFRLLVYVQVIMLRASFCFSLYHILPKYPRNLKSLLESVLIFRRARIEASGLVETIPSLNLRGVVHTWIASESDASCTENGAVSLKSHLERRCLQDEVVATNAREEGDRN